MKAAMMASIKTHNQISWIFELRGVCVKATVRLCTLHIPTAGAVSNVA